jgi:hypothetical protein
MLKKEGMKDDLKQYFYDKGFWEGFFTGVAICIVAVPAVMKVVFEIRLSKISF